MQADKSSQKAASGWMGVLKQHCADLEVGLAQEHQNRVRQEREKVICCASVVNIGCCASVVNIGCYACCDNTAAAVLQ